MRSHYLTPESLNAGDILPKPSAWFFMMANKDVCAPPTRIAPPAMGHFYRAARLKRKMVGQGIQAPGSDYRYPITTDATELPAGSLILRPVGLKDKFAALLQPEEIRQGLMRVCCSLSGSSTDVEEDTFPLALATLEAQKIMIRGMWPDGLQKTAHLADIAWLEQNNLPRESVLRRSPFLSIPSQGL